MQGNIPFTFPMVSICVTHFRVKFGRNSHTREIHMCVGMWL